MGHEGVPHNFPEQESVIDAVVALRTAVFEGGHALTWSSSDGQYEYSALPLDEPESYSGLCYLPASQLRQMFRNWRIMRYSTTLGINGDVVIDDFGLIPGSHLLVTRFELPADLFETTDPEEIQVTINKEILLQLELGLSQACLTDYAALENAIYDLKMSVSA